MCVGATGAWFLVTCLLAATRAIEVQRLEVFFEQLNTVTVNNTIEYVLEFSPVSEQAMWPTRLWMSVQGGDTARPVIVTVRQPTGAQTWQLPFQTQTSSSLLYELTRTLCFNMTESALSPMAGAFSLHVSTSGADNIAVSTFAHVARDWLLSFATPTHLHVTPTAPAVYFYQWRAEQASARLVLASGDDVCALVAVENYSCPVPETEEQVNQGGGLRMTMLRSGGIFISRDRFPLGFTLVVLVLDSDEPCLGETETPETPDWLYEAVLTDRVETTTPDLGERRKTLDISFRAALTVGQYWLATSVTLLVFLLFYAAFFALVFAQRLPAFKRHVAPKAVLANTPAAEEGQLPDGAHRQWRRDSNVTLDSLDDDSASDEESQPPRKTSAPGHTPTSAVTPSTNTAVPGAVLISDSTAPSSVGATNEPAPITPPDSFADPAPAARSHADGEPATDATEIGRGSGGGPSTGPTPGAAAGAPFGLPATLTLAALSRRGARTLRARSDRYLQLLYTVAVFYALPVLQFVAAFQIVLWVSGSLDLCYYNFLCAHPLGAVSDFNHVFSNAGYLLLGALFMLQLRRRRLRRVRKPRDEEYGIPAHYGLLASLGAGMMVVALLSASYHICPNRLNFQFDTAFMYVLAVLVKVKLYQARHPDINARAHATYGVLAVLIALVVWGVLGGGPLFWAVFTVLHVFTFLLLSMRIYYLNQFRLEGAALAEAARGLGAGGSRPLYVTRLVLLAIANSLNWMFALYGLNAMPTDFATHLLFVLLGNALLYMVFYVTMKLRHGERLRWYAWAFTAAAAGTWAPALYFFTSGSSSWSATPAQSRHFNHECRILQFYDSHDFWHMLSAAALYFTFNALLTWDDGLSEVKRTQIAVF